MPNASASTTIVKSLYVEPSPAATRLRRDAGDVGERVDVAAGELGRALEVLVELGERLERDRGVQLRHPGVQADEARVVVAGVAVVAPDADRRRRRRHGSWRRGRPRRDHHLGRAHAEHLGVAEAADRHGRRGGRRRRGRRRTRPARRARRRGRSTSSTAHGAPNTCVASTAPRPSSIAARAGRRRRRAGTTPGRTRRTRDAARSSARRGADAEKVKLGQHDRAVGIERPQRQHQPGGARRHRDDVAHARAWPRRWPRARDERPVREHVRSRTTARSGRRRARARAAAGGRAGSRRGTRACPRGRRARSCPARRRRRHEPAQDEPECEDGGGAEGDADGRDRRRAPRPAARAAVSTTCAATHSSAACGVLRWCRTLSWSYTWLRSPAVRAVARPQAAHDSERGVGHRHCHEQRHRHPRGDVVATIDHQHREDREPGAR